MLPDEVGVDVDHLRLDPQAELHPESGDVLHQRVQTLGPHGRVDRPVTETRAVVPTAAEPAVVQDEPLRPDLGGPVGEVPQLVEVVVEVHRLPRVHHHRPRRPRARRALPEPAVQSRTHPVETGPGPGAEEKGRVVGLARRQDDLARSEQLAASEECLPLRCPLGVGHVVTAPGDVHAPHRAAAEAEGRRPGHHHQGRVVAGATVTPGPLPGALVEGATLRCPLPGPPPRQVEDLHRLRGDGQHVAHRADEVRRTPGVLEPGPAGHHAVPVERDHPGHGQPRLDVLGGQRGGVAVDLERPRVEPWRPRLAAVGPPALDRRRAGVPGDVLRHDPGPARVVERAVRPGRGPGRDVRGDVLVGQLAEVGAPVQDDRCDPVARVGT